MKAILAAVVCLAVCACRSEQGERAAPTEKPSNQAIERTLTDLKDATKVQLRADFNERTNKGLDFDLKGANATLAKAREHAAASGVPQSEIENAEAKGREEMGNAIRRDLSKPID
ncbi:hypothetical protein OJ996_00515 [Luteolibacter sp. GHJ8]|uniref:Lipoprotein n=1 Tax=Luteolibacter rhizosphaerae TaxID=2989719 RepID=A0ABT3FWR0_9BACT|nr:hypothetical protein [Luteolibacter rhizosphaerae]MCW1912036.1 hypothetical protein [Luteolibacter rhizosphaerae]